MTIIFPGHKTSLTTLDIFGVDISGRAAVPSLHCHEAARALGMRRFLEAYRKEWDGFQAEALNDVYAALKQEGWVQACDRDGWVKAGQRAPEKEEP